MQAKRLHKTKPDLMLLVVIGILACWGLFVLGTVTFPLSLEKFGSPFRYFFHQAELFGLGCLFAYLFYRIPLVKLRKYSLLFFLVNLLLVFLVFLPQIGIESKGAQRWLNLGFFSLQPSEFLKLSFLIYLAAFFSKARQKLDRKKLITELLLPFTIILLILIAGLYLQKDLTTLGIICLTSLAVYFFSSSPWWHILIMVVVCASAFALFIIDEPYRLHRLTTYLNPSEDPLGKGWQLKQASIAIGSGSILGVNNGLGLGMSRQKFGFLPESQTDSIFAIIAEEGGLMACLILLGLFLMLFWLGLKIAMQKKEQHKEFEALLCFGIVFWLCFQALYNIAGITGLAPLGGVPLPFFSYGGSHLMAELMACGVLLNISKKT